MPQCSIYIILQNIQIIVTKSPEVYIIYVHVYICIEYLVNPLMYFMLYAWYCICMYNLNSRTQFLFKLAIHIMVRYCHVRISDIHKYLHFTRKYCSIEPHLAMPLFGDLLPFIPLFIHVLVCIVIIPEAF